MKDVDKRNKTEIIDLYRQGYSFKQITTKMKYKKIEESDIQKVIYQYVLERSKQE